MSDILCQKYPHNILDITCTISFLYTDCNQCWAQLTIGDFISNLPCCLIWLLILKCLSFFSGWFPEGGWTICSARIYDDGRRIEYFMLHCQGEHVRRAEGSVQEYSVRYFRCCRLHILHLRAAVGAGCGVVFNVPAAERLLLHDRHLRVGAVRHCRHHHSHLVRFSHKSYQLQSSARHPGQGQYFW